MDSSADLFKLLEDYSALTGTQFPNIQQLSLATKASEQDYLQQRFLTPSARPRLFWQMHAGEPVIPFDGVPFISVGQGTEIPCVLAGRRKTTTQVLVATGDVLPTKVHTQGCNAKVSIRRILRYPSGRLPDTGVQGITALRRLRKQMLEVLTAKICAGSVNPMERFYFSLPTPLAHDSHSVPEIEDPPSLIEPVHDEILSQIGQKITSVGHIDSHVKKFVETTYGEDPSINIQDPTFLPSRYDLMRYIYWLYRSGRAVDPECLFRERYSLLNEENEPDKQQPQTETTPTTTPSSAVVKHADTPHPDHALSNIYNIVLGSDGGGAMELGGAQLGAEETASTTSTSSLPGLASTHQESVKIVSSGSRLVAAPKSMIFTPPQRGTEQVRDKYFHSSSHMCSLHSSPSLLSFSPPSFPSLSLPSLFLPLPLFPPPFPSPFLTSPLSLLPPSLPPFPLPPSLSLSPFLPSPLSPLPSPQVSDQSSSMASQSQADIRSMLQIIENQTYACHDLNALQTLRRQLTVLCTEFSMHLAGTPKRTNEPSLMSLDNKRQKLN